MEKKKRKKKSNKTLQTQPVTSSIKLTLDLRGPLSRFLKGFLNQMQQQIEERLRTKKKKKTKTTRNDGIDFFFFFFSLKSCCVG